MTPPGTSTEGSAEEAGESHHHRGQALVAGGHAEHAAPRGQAADEAAEDGGGVVAIGERIVHAGGALQAAVAGVRTIAREGQRADALKLARSRVHHQAHFPVAGVVAERDDAAVGGAQAAVGAEDEVFGRAEARRVEAHAGIERPAEQVARGPVAQLLRRDGQGALRSGGVAGEAEQRAIAGVENGG